MTVRAGIVVTGTEVLAGLIADKNGPWLSERLRDHGVELAEIVIVGDRAQDLRCALEQLAGLGVDLIVTSGGLGPTADDLTTEVVAAFAGTELVGDAALEERIMTIVERYLTARRAAQTTGVGAADGDSTPAGGTAASAGKDLAASDEPRTSSDRQRSIAERVAALSPAAAAGAVKQARIPAGSVVLEPTGTAPGLLVQTDGPLIVVLPGPPPELREMWLAAVQTEPLASLLARSGAIEHRIAHLYGVPEPDIAETLSVLPNQGIALDSLEITTCMRRGELELATAFDPSAQADYDAFLAALAERHGAALFDREGVGIDRLIADRLAGHETVAVAESCTGGLMTGRLTELPGSSAYVLGGLVVYANEAKTAHAGVSAELIERHGAVSIQVAAALADGARERFGSSLGIGITGIAGPGGGTEQKPVGTVFISVSHRRGERIDRAFALTGDRAAIRDRSTTAALHLVWGLLAEPNIL